jgi:hypothetical protein
MAQSPEELLEQIRLKSQQPNANGFTGGQGVLPATENPFAVQTGVAPQAPVVSPTIANEQAAIPRMTPELAAQREEARGPMEDSSFLGNIGSLFQSTDSGQRLAGGAEGLAGGVSSLSQSSFDSAVTQPVQAASDLVGQVTGGNVNLSSPALPEGTVASAQETTGSPVTTVDQFNAFMKGLNEEAAAQQPSTPESIAGLSVNGTDVVTPEALTGAGQAQPASPQQAEANSPQANFNARMATGEPLTDEEINTANALAESMGTTFNAETGYSRDAFEQFQAAQPALSAPQQGQSLSDYVAYRDAPQDATVQVQDAQGRFRRQAAPVAGETPEQNLARTNSILPEQARFQQASADREARQAARPDFREALSDRDRRAASGEGISTSDRKDMAKANVRGASASDIARGNKIANELGVDLKTGESKSTGMTREQNLAERKFQAGLAENNRQWETAQADKAAEAAAGVQETQQSRQKSIERMDGQLSFLKNSAKEMSSLQDWSTEGFAGWLAEKLPIKTKAAQVNRLATSFQGNAFLRSIIDSKSLGATFGALSDSEGTKITAAETILIDTKQGNPERMAAAKQIIDVIENARALAMKEQGGGASSAPRYSDDQDDGVKVETYYQG